MPDDKKYCVYRHTFPNGKVYIGITCQKPHERWCNGTGYKHQQLIYRAILRYGWENVQHEVVAEGLTHDQACGMEVELIKAYDSTNPKCGYNTSPGGESGNGLRGERHPMYGRHHTEESRRKMRESTMGQIPYNKGKHLSKEHREKLRQAHLGRKQNRTPEWNRKIGESQIGKKLRPETKERIGLAHSIPVVQISVSGEVLQEWPSAAEANRATGVDRSHISLVCRNKRKTAGGFVWKFAADLQGGINYGRNECL